MRALVTGGTGYLGSFLVRQWAALHGTDSVTCLVPPFGNAAECATRTAFERESIHCVDADLCRRPVAPNLPGPWDVVFHLAAATDTTSPESELAPLNVDGTKNLLDALTGTIRGKRVLLTSTSAAVDRRARPCGRPLTEESPCHPRTGYGKTKLAAECIVKDWCAREGAEYTIARLTTLYGPGVRTGLVPVLAEGIRHGNPSAKIDWPGRTSMLFIDDAVRILLFLAKSSEAANETFFLTSGEALRIGDVAGQIARWLGPDKHLLRLPRWFWALARGVIWLPVVNRAVPWRLLHALDDGLWCDNSKVSRLYAHSLVPLAEGLARTFGEPHENHSNRTAPSQTVPA